MHECPDCGISCHCNGDIDDLMLNDESDVAGCTHCWRNEDDEPEYPEYRDDDFDEEDDDADA